MVLVQANSMKHLIWVALAATMLFSAAPRAMAQSDPRAEKLLKRLEQKLESYDRFRADFRYTMVNQAANLEETQEGVILVDQQGRFRLTMPEQTIYCDLEKLTVWMQDLNEVQISKYRPEEFEFAPSEMFKMYESGFVYAMLGKKKVDSKSYTQVELTPKDKSKPYFKIKLLIDESAMEPYQTELRYKNGNVYTYTIKAFDPNPDVPATFYRFDESEHPDATVVDLR
jgi:outer membrane lipoprotein-sorting protein